MGVGAQFVCDSMVLITPMGKVCVLMYWANPIHDIVGQVLIFGLKLVLLAMFLVGCWYMRKQWVLREVKRVEKKNEKVQKIVELVQQGQTNVV